MIRGGVDDKFRLLAGDHFVGLVAIADVELFVREGDEIAVPNVDEVAS